MLSIKHKQNDILFEIEGSLDALTVEIIRPQLNELVQDELDVVIDLTRIDFIDSSGIGAIVFLFKRLRSLDRTLTLTGVHGQPLELLQHLRIDKSICITQ